ncbi:MAG: 7-cyano-7-deazaguanine synthase QueC [Planctomycetota bacterium]
MGSEKPAVVLLSGGLDSATVMAIAKSEGYQVHAISFNYGQRHKFELERARALAAHAGVEDHVVVDIDLAQFGGSALTAAIEVPKHESAEEIGDEIPVTYVPARNTVFLSLALAFAETRGADDLFIGVNALDYSGYPDCRPEYIDAFAKMANLATKAGVEQDGEGIVLHTPLIDLTKAQIIARGLELGVDYSQTISCYDPSPSGFPCGHCDACLLRIRGFEQNGMSDPSMAVS